MKKVILILTGVVLVLLLIGFDNYTRTYFDKNDKIVKELNLLKQKELKLNYEIFTISVYLYKNFDPIVNLEREIDVILDNLTKDKEFQTKQKAYENFLIYKKDLKSKINKIYELETIIAPLKNADMYIAELVTKLPNLPLKKSEKALWIDITANIFLAKNSLDKTFIKDLDTKLAKLKNHSYTKYNQVFIKNIELINTLFPKYIKGMNSVLHSKTQEEFKETFKNFLIETNEKLKFISFVSIVLIIFIILSILLIIYLFTSLEKENKILEKMIVTDELTQLYNRRKLQADIKENKTLFIVNIDRFKYYNDLYGVKVGDYILQDIAKKLTEIVPKKYRPSFYRLGGDDFGILCGKLAHEDIELITTKIISHIKNHPIVYKDPEVYKDIEFYVTVSIGVSAIIPLIETTDIALRKVKKEKKRSFAIYNPSLNEKEKLKENMEKVLILKKALKHDNIIPYYQPIFSNKTGEIVKYEVLARLLVDGEVLSIYPFLDILKENKDYKYVTKAICLKSFEKFKDTKIPFSINISIEDINNEETMVMMYELIDKYPSVFEYVTFEILEDDAIKNYEKLKKFIKLLKKFKAKIAIDDFGSGYSNFAHILNLDVDYLKIDGSLIKNIHTDRKAYLIVETIVDFAKKTDMEVIAEFVHNKEVLETVKKLNIEYSQGFYLAEPKGDVL